MKKLLQIGALIGALAMACSGAHAQLGVVAPGHVIGNGSSTNPSAATDYPLSSVMDQALCTTQGDVPQRGASTWTCGTPSSTFGNQSANQVFSGPTTGSPATPTFRALVGADIPAVALGTVGTNGGISGTLGTGNGGTGLTSLGTGVQSALGNTVNAANGLLTYGIIGTSGAAVPLLNGSNTWSAAQTFAALDFNGNWTFGSAPIVSGLTSGTCAATLVLTSSNALSTGSCSGASFAAPVVCDIISTSAITCNNGGSAANNGTYTTPVGALYLEVKACGAGGGGGGNGTSGATNGSAGNNTTFGALTASGGSGGTGNNGTGGVAGGAGGAASGGDQNVTGQTGIGASGSLSGGSGSGTGGGSPYYGGGGAGGVNGGGGAGSNGITNTGGGGGGASAGGSIGGGGGGGGGGCLTKTISSPSATYSYAIGSGGTAGGAGAAGGAGGTGAAGRLTIAAKFQ